jgi:predicted nuclease of restriction endonuclease-like (RecB) superfamily
MAFSIYNPSLKNITMNLEKQFSEVIELIRKAQANSYKAVNVELINCYWQVGHYISSRVTQSNWGDKTVVQLAEYIQKRYPDMKGYTRVSLYRMRQFYETYHDAQFVSPVGRQLQNTETQPNEIVAPVGRQLGAEDIRGSILVKTSWTNHRIILESTKTNEEREFYILLAIRENYSKRELERQIKSGIFERFVLGDRKLTEVLKDFKKEGDQLFKDSYVFEFLNLPKTHNENDLQKALIKQMKDFILEIGKDFAFVGNEYRLQVGNSEFYIDLLFYHRGLLCLVAFELKAEKFKPEHLGQINFYLEALDRNVKKPDENPSIGVLLCQDQDTEVVKYALSRSLSPAMVAKYETQLPDKKLLQQKMHEISETINNS